MTKGEYDLCRIHKGIAQLPLDPSARLKGTDVKNHLAELGTCYLAEEPIGAFVEKFGRLLRPGG